MPRVFVVKIIGEIEKQLDDDAYFLGKTGEDILVEAIADGIEIRVLGSVSVKDIEVIEI